MTISVLDLDQRKFWANKSVFEVSVFIAWTRTRTNSLCEIFISFQTSATEFSKLLIISDWLLWLRILRRQLFFLPDQTLPLMPTSWQIIALHQSSERLKSLVSWPGAWDDCLDAGLNQNTLFVLPPTVSSYLLSLCFFWSPQFSSCFLLPFPPTLVRLAALPYKALEVGSYGGGDVRVKSLTHFPRTGRWSSAGWRCSSRPRSRGPSSDTHFALHMLSSMILLSSLIRS